VNRHLGFIYHRHYPMSAGGQIGLIDYGQSKQLPQEARLAFARLVRTKLNTEPRRPHYNNTLSALDIEQQDAAPSSSRMAHSVYPAAVIFVSEREGLQQVITWYTK